MRYLCLSVIVIAIAGCGSASPPGPSCTDGVKNASETDVDCGGTSCGKCADGKSCGGGGDCASGLCEASACVTWSAATR